MHRATPLAPPSLASTIAQLGQAGRRLAEIDASEGAAGNLSVYLRSPDDSYAGLSYSEVVALPLAVPELAGGRLIVTGSGTRSREIAEAPLACLGCIEIHDDGKTGALWYGKERQFARVTSELNSHLAVHRSHVSRGALRFHAVVHAQPRRVTYLSHIEAYQDPQALNRRLLRWQPEGILNFPEGIAVVPFLVPGQPELMQASEQALRNRRIVVWAKHGVMARSNDSVLAAVDLIEYLETAASYEILDRALGGAAQGLTAEQIRAVSLAYGVEQELF